MAALALLPDADVIAFVLRIPYSAVWTSRRVPPLAIGNRRWLVLGTLLAPMFMVESAPPLLRCWR